MAFTIYVGVGNLESSPGKDKLFLDPVQGLRSLAEYLHMPLRRGDTSSAAAAAATQALCRCPLGLPLQTPSYTGLALKFRSTSSHPTCSTSDDSAAAGRSHRLRSSLRARGQARCRWSSVALDVSSCSKETTMYHINRKRHDYSVPFLTAISPFSVSRSPANVDTGRCSRRQALLPFC